MAVARIAVAYLATLVLFVAVDLLWLGVVARGVYRRHLGHLMAEEVNWWAAGAFYLLFMAGVFVFAALPALERGSAGHAVAAGALLGLVAYGTYDLVNLATLEGWPVAIVAVDMAWGTGFVAGTSYVAFRLLEWLG